MDDIDDQFAGLRALADGWHDGDGVAFDPAGLDWLGSSIREQVARGMPTPRIYPVPDGRVMMEWTIGTREASLEIDLGRKTGYWHVLDMATDEADDATLDLGGADGWRALADRLAERA